MLVLRELDLDFIVMRSEDVSKLLRNWLATIDPVDQDKEHLFVIAVNTHCKVQAIDVVSIGILNAALIHAREVYRRAIVLAAGNIIVAHNHPSGDCTPSDEDQERTKALSQAGKIIGIGLLDHIIFSKSSYFSFADEGLI